MDKRIAALLGAAAALTTVNAAAAAPEPPPGQAPAASYRDLLESVPNALAALRADDARTGNTPASEGVRLADEIAIRRHHHHHHHHHGRRRMHHHHHHHHHHHY
jgi:hypothetical protein